MADFSSTELGPGSETWGTGKTLYLTMTRTPGYEYTASAFSSVHWGQ